MGLPGDPPRKMWRNLGTQEQKKGHKSVENWRYKANNLPRVSENTLNNTFKTNIMKQIEATCDRSMPRFYDAIYIPMHFS
jgi:hypothetical protein